MPPLARRRHGPVRALGAGALVLRLLLLVMVPLPTARAELLLVYSIHRHGARNVLRKSSVSPTPKRYSGYPPFHS